MSTTLSPLPPSSQATISTAPSTHSDPQSGLQDPSLIKLAAVCSSINDFYLHLATQKEAIINVHKRKERDWEEEKERIKIRKVALESGEKRIQELTARVDEVTEKNEALTREKIVLEQSKAEIEKRLEEQKTIVQQLEKQLLLKDQPQTALQTSNHQRLPDLQEPRGYQESTFYIPVYNVFEDFLL